MTRELNILYIGDSQVFFERANQLHPIFLTIKENNLEAVNYLENNARPDAIICDYHLPGNNGLYLFDWLKQHPEIRTIPFILLSHEFSGEVFKCALAKGVDDYYVQAVSTPEEILNRVDFLHQFKSGKNGLKSLEKKAKESYRLPTSKRIFDIILASAALLLSLPLLLVIILAIRLESKGKVYYIAKRMGRKTFNFYKLRSMRAGSDALLKKLAKENNQYNDNSQLQEKDIEYSCPKCFILPDGKTCSPMMYVDKSQTCEYWYNYKKKEQLKHSSAFVKIAKDPRITRVGKFIRNTSIDELPQLINVIKGDMSIVGNRPLPVYEAELLTKDTLSKRFLAPAGITGLWQVELRGKGGNMSETERISLDNKYADHFNGDNYSFWYDIKLILRTIPALLQRSTV